MQNTPLLEEQQKKLGASTAGSATTMSSGAETGTQKTKDPSGFRTGEPPSAQAADTLQKTAGDAKNYINKVSGWAQNHLYERHY